MEAPILSGAHLFGRGAARDLTVLGRGPSARGLWSELVATDEQVPITKTPAWLDCVCSSGQFSDSTIAYRTAEGRRLVLPLVSRVVGGVPVGVRRSMPHGWDLGLDSGGLLCEGGGAPTPAEVLAVMAELGRRTAVNTHVVPSRQDETAWAVAAGSLATTTHLAHELDLSGGFDVVWTSRFTSKARSNARKAQRRGVEVELDSSGRLVEVFDRMYRKSVERWALQARLPVAVSRRIAHLREPVEKFAAVSRALGEQCVTAIAWRDGRPLAGIVVLSKGRQATYWRGAMDKDLAQSSGANELLHRTMVERACAADMRSYDMGPSHSRALAAFKEGFGARERAMTGYVFERLPLVAAEDHLRRGVKAVLRARPGTSAQRST